jgi:tetratricopeptide (TPR) repeat protein
VLADAVAAADARPDDYFLRIAIADARTTFARVHPKYLEGVEQDLAKARAISPNRQETFYIDAKVRLLQKDTEAAIKDMEAAIALDPLAAKPHYNYALLLARFVSFEAAAPEFELAFERGMRITKAQDAVLVGGLLADAEQYDRALVYLKQAHELEPANNEYLAKYAIVSYYAGLRDQAKKLFITLIQITPDLKESPNYGVLRAMFIDVGVDQTLL